MSEWLEWIKRGLDLDTPWPWLMYAAVSAVIGAAFAAAEKIEDNWRAIGMAVFFALIWPAVLFFAVLFGFAWITFVPLIWTMCRLFAEPDQGK